MQKAHSKSWLVAGVLLALLLTARPAKSQDEAAKKTTQTEPKEATERTRPPANVYRLEYKVHELEDGKRTNSRSYTIFVKAPRDKAFLRTGNRIPINVGSISNSQAATAQVQYLDVGMDIDSSVDEQEGKLLVNTVLHMSSVAPTDSAGSSVSNSTGNPVLRDLRLNDVTLAVVGKPTLVGSVDDVTANRRYEIEVTATKVD